jgi:hypothetical protein
MANSKKMVVIYMLQIQYVTDNTHTQHIVTKHKVENSSLSLTSTAAGSRGGKLQTRPVNWNFMRP